jgi:RecA/RadA recombinase
MAAKKKEPKEEVELRGDALLDEKLGGLKAGGIPFMNLFKYADEYTDTEYTYRSTGFASLDVAINPKNPGLPCGVDVEVSSGEGNTGKTTLVLQILKEWQDQGLQTCLAEPEKTNTQGFWDQLGIITRRNQDPSKYAMRIMRPEWDRSSEESTIYSAEEFLNGIGAASQVMDLIVVDSIDALVQVADITKDSDDAAKMCGIAQLLGRHLRKFANKKATVLWVNQERMAPGQFSPGGGTAKTTSGGKSISFYTSLRLRGVRIESLKESTDSDPYGFITQWGIFKNKVAPQDRKVKLKYIHGEGFSNAYDLFDLAVKLKAIQKDGGWYQFPCGDVKKNKSLRDHPLFTRIQGGLNFYRELRDNPALFAGVKMLLDGEDVTLDDLSNQAQATIVAEAKNLVDSHAALL